jgi:dolichyl-phosphate beta-glucosyltransferase
MSANVAPFPSLVSNPAEVDLTLVVPAYKEEKRLAKMMEETLPVVKQMVRDKAISKWEVIIVDDGSSDKTSEVALMFTVSEGASQVRLCRLKHNRGKGGAVRMGMLRARGKAVLMLDADGATAAEEIPRIFEAGLSVFGDGEKRHGIVVGSRAPPEGSAEEGKAQRDALRRFTQWGMHQAVQIIGGVEGIRDTQCGFKLFSRRSAASIFPVLHLERWAFDVEVLFLASRVFSVPIVELFVEWNEIEGSHLSVIRDTIQIIRDMVATRVCYVTGVWSPRDVVASARGADLGPA